MLQDGGWTISPWAPTDLVGLFSDTIFTTPKGRVQLRFLFFGVLSDDRLWKNQFMKQSSATYTIRVFQKHLDFATYWLDT